MWGFGAAVTLNCSRVTLFVAHVTVVTVFGLHVTLFRRGVTLDVTGRVVWMRGGLGTVATRRHPGGLHAGYCAFLDKRGGGRRLGAAAAVRDKCRGANSRGPAAATRARPARDTV